MTFRIRLAALSFVVPAALAAQRVDGRLVDRASGTAISGATVTLASDGLSPDLSVSTDSAGRFSVSAMVPGTYALRVRKIGMAPAITNGFWLGPLTQRRALLQVDAQATGLDTVRVVAKGLTVSDWTHDFYERRRTSRGTFLTTSDVSGRAPIQPSDWLLGVRGVTLQYSGSRVRLVSNRTAGACSMDVYVDNLPVPDGDLNASLRADDIAAIEVYTSALDSPMRFRQRGCGLILVWTRSDADPTDVAESGATKP